jgi:hypothetical protein
MMTKPQFLYLEACLLSLYRWVMFCNVVDTVLLPYARAIVDAKEGDILGWSWGATVLAARYTGLCQGEP